MEINQIKTIEHVQIKRPPRLKNFTLTLFKIENPIFFFNKAAF